MKTRKPKPKPGSGEAALAGVAAKVGKLLEAKLVEGGFAFDKVVIKFNTLHDVMYAVEHGDEEPIASLVFNGCKMAPGELAEACYQSFLERLEVEKRLAAEEAAEKADELGESG